MHELMNLFSPETFISILPMLALIGIVILALLLTLSVIGIVCECRSESRRAERSGFGMLLK